MPCRGMKHAGAAPRSCASARRRSASSTRSPGSRVRGICGSAKSTPSCENRPQWHVQPAEGVDRLWMGMHARRHVGSCRHDLEMDVTSMCTLPSPKRRLPSHPTSRTVLWTISSYPQPADFIHTPRPCGSRRATCPQIMSCSPTALNARPAWIVCPMMSESG